MGRDWPGSYTSVSVTGDDAYFTALGLPELVRRGMCMFLSDPTTLKVTMEGGGDTMVLDMPNTPSWLVWLSRVTIGEELKVKNNDGLLLTAKASWEGDDFLVTVKPVHPDKGAVGWTQRRQIDDETGVLTVINIPNGDSTCAMIRRWQKPVMG